MGASKNTGSKHEHEYTHPESVYRRDARLSRSPAALRLLAIGAAMPRRRALPANPSDAPRLPQNLFAMGILP